VRDEDVLDTWFSSALWPFSTLGWPDQTPELGRYYKTDVLVTGFDIIFFWVARMMMMGLHFMKDEDGAPEVPFHTVYIHALVRDEKGQKMSKSKGNIIDPLELIEEYGADALRFTLAAMAAQGRDIKLARSRVEGYRNFATKLWNAARFCQMKGCEPDPALDVTAVQHKLNRWIAGETERTAEAVSEAIESHRYNEAAGALYHFVWHIFCDWYVELIKPLLDGDDDAAKRETRAVAAWTLDQILLLMHPFMPFITEELWAQLSGDAERGTSLMLASWPQFTGLQNPDADSEIAWVIEVISQIRSVRAEMNVPAGAKTPVVLVGANEATLTRVGAWRGEISRLARLDGIKAGAEVPDGAVQIVLDEAIIALPLAGIIDVNAEIERLKKELGKIADEIAKLDAKLTNENFTSRAPEHVVDEQRSRKAEAEERRERINEAFDRLKGAA
jgi:valyl-tRNA synthetase